uniref:Uncharacterized protein n=1 Tax=Anopheles christyi TaxID=43041 RepID=A0A182JUZ8_9DIPT
MLFESECAFFMSAAVAASSAKSATTEMAEATQSMTMSPSLSIDVTFSNGFFDFPCNIPWNLKMTNMIEQKYRQNSNHKHL